jgi:hypothetical protein
MKPMLSIPKIALLGAAVALSACQPASEIASANPSGNHDGNDPDGVKLLFSDTFSDQGALEIVSDESGQIHYSVQSRIGSDAERLMRQIAWQPTLADLYRSLQEGPQEVPEAVRKASARLEAQKLLAAATESPMAQPLPKAAKSAEINVEEWWKAYCTDIYEGAFHYAEKFCEFKASTNSMTNGRFLGSNGDFVDRTYALNNTRWTATMSHSVNGWKPTVAPYSMIWVEWGGTYQDTQAKISLPSGKLGALAITAHKAYRRRFIDL